MTPQLCKKSLFFSILIFRMIASVRTQDSECSVISTPAPPEGKQVYRIGVLANRGEDTAIKEFNQTFSTYLTKTAGKLFDPPISFSMEPVAFGLRSAIDKFIDDGYDFLFANPSVFSCVESEVGATSLLTFISRRVVNNQEHFLTNFGGVVVVRADNNEVNTLADVRGKRVAAVSISGLGSGQMQFRELSNIGIHHLQDVKQILFMEKQGKIVDAVLDGSIDVGFVRTDQLERSIDPETGELLDLDRVKIIDPRQDLISDGKAFPFPASTPLYPEWAFGSIREQPDEVVSAVQTALHQISVYAANANKNCTADELSIAQIATDALLNGKYGGWRISLPYMDLRNMQEIVGFIEPASKDGKARCVRSSEIADAVDCPPNYHKKTDLEIESGCHDVGLDCYGFQCLCSPCVHDSELVSSNRFPDHFFFPVVIGPSFLAIVILFLLYRQHKKHKENFIWKVKPEELCFKDPPHVLGRGTFGVVLLAEYHGTQVAVKRILPPRDEVRASTDTFYGTSRPGLNDTGLRSTINEKREVLFGTLECSVAPQQGTIPIDIEMGKAQTNKTWKADEAAIKSVRWNLADDQKRRKNDGKSFFDYGSTIKKRSKAYSSSSGTRSGRTSKRLLSSEYAHLRKQFVEEMRQVAQLRHPCITTVMGAVISPGVEPMLVMQYMELGSLYDLLHNESMPMDGDVILPILRDISSGLRFLHAADIVHADLKAANVLVDSKFRASLSDFGFSQKRFFSSQKANTTGTPFWMAPELLRGETVNTLESDVFSFAIVLCEVFSRQHPYEDELNFEEVLREIADPDIQKRPCIPGNCPSEIVEMIKACWKDEAHDRPSAEDIDVRLRMLDADRIQAEELRGTRVNKKEATTEALLNDLFPPHVSKALRAGQKVEPECFDCVTVCFLDIVGYTALSAKLTPLKVSDLLDRLYTALDRLSGVHRVFKVETIGDAYMVVTGLLVKQPEHARVMSYFAMDAIAEASVTLIDNDNPSLGYVQLRAGINSGPVVAHVVGSRTPRYSIIGDTVNTSSRMESTSLPGKIQMTSFTASLLKEQAPDLLLKYRGSISIKGKGMMETFFLFDESTEKSASSGDVLLSKTEIVPDTNFRSVLPTICQHKVKTNNRLIDWNVDLLLRLLKQIVTNRNIATTPFGREQKKSFVEPQHDGVGCFMDELEEIINLHDFTKRDLKKRKENQVALQLPPKVVEQVRGFVTAIARMYKPNAFHSFEHACHVTMSAVKLMGQVVAPSELGSESDVISIHKYSHGISTDPLIQFTVVLSTLIHDVDHPGVPNVKMAEENPTLSQRYKWKSVAEQNSLDKSWNLLMESTYKELRETIYANTEEYNRFRSLLVNCVLSTDVMDKELKELRNQRWKNAFGEQLPVGSSKDIVNRKATIVIEHMIQASDVAHTMEHWTVYRKWNSKFFVECCNAYRAGRADRDPIEFWYQGELSFFDNYVIPLAEKLQSCGVFGALGDDYLNTAVRNRQEWELRGQQVVAELVEQYRRGSLCSTSSSSNCSDSHNDCDDIIATIEEDEVFEQEEEIFHQEPSEL